VLRAEERQHTEPRPLGQGGHAVHESVFHLAGVRAEPVGVDDRLVRDDDRHAPHAKPSHGWLPAAGRRATDHAFAAGRRLSHGEHHAHWPAGGRHRQTGFEFCCGRPRVRRQGLGRPEKEAAVLRADQHARGRVRYLRPQIRREASREMGRRGMASQGRHAGERQAAAVLSRPQNHARRMGALPQLRHRHRRTHRLDFGAGSMPAAFTGAGTAACTCR